MRKVGIMVALMALMSLVASPAHALVVTPTSDGSTLASEILGTGISISNVVYSGADVASGLFTGGGSTVGINSGIILTSGDASLAVGPNSEDSVTGSNGLGGDADLATLIPGYDVYDATILEFDFSSTGGDLYFNYVFASDEYNEFTNTSFNDVFGFFLDGNNIALIPGTTTPVSINNVNGGNPLGDSASYPEYYVNNDPSDGGPYFDIEYDGFTTVFTAQALGLAEGTHHIKLAIADAGDSILDSAVFIQASSFSDTPTDPNVIPEPASMILFGTGLLGLAGYRKKRS